MLFQIVLVMKRIACLLILISLLCPPISQGADEAVFLNAFGETATAYLNDSFLLLGTTADGFVADIISKETALEIVKKRPKTSPGDSGEVPGRFSKPDFEGGQTAYRTPGQCLWLHGSSSLGIDPVQFKKKHQTRPAASKDRGRTASAT